MLNKYPLWKNLLLLGILMVGFIYALPNLFGEDPAIQVIPKTSYKIDADMGKNIEAELKQAGIAFKGVNEEDSALLIRLSDEAAQLKAKEIVKSKVGNNYITALNLAPKTPYWLSLLGAKPMKLGLDLRGGGALFDGSGCEWCFR